MSEINQRKGCDGTHHYLITKEGRFLWCLPDECATCGTGRERA